MSLDADVAVSAGSGLAHKLKRIACEDGLGGFLEATAAGLHKDTVSAIKAMNSGFDAEYFPNPENAAAYDEKYKLYCAYCDGLEKMTMENL